MNKGENAKNYYEEVVQTIDTETGEVEVVERKVKRKVSREKFIMMFLSDIQGIIGLTSKSEFQVLLAITELVSFNTNEVILIKPVKMIIAEKTKLKYDSVKNTISRLHKKEILIRKASSTYVLNPKYFFKGEDTARSSVLKWTIEYVINDDENDKKV